MAYTSMLKLALALKQSLVTNLPALVDAVNVEYPDAPIAMPAPEAFFLGVRTEMIQLKLPKLPAMACGIYLREAIDEGEQPYSMIMMPYVIDIYLGSDDADILYIQAHKWAIVFDQWAEAYASELEPGFLSEEAPNIDISYTLENRDKTFRQLVSATGVLSGME